MLTQNFLGRMFVRQEAGLELRKPSLLQVVVMYVVVKIKVITGSVTNGITMTVQDACQPPIGPE
jgi:hypothetical protein